MSGVDLIFAVATEPHGLLLSLAGTLARHGYAILFGMVAAESFCSPLPGELSLGAAAYAASRGRLDLAAVVCVAAAAAVTGDNLAYLFGRRAGRLLVARLCSRLHVTERRLARIDAAFTTHTGVTVAAARWLSPVRGLAALTAGATRVSWRRFAWSNAAGSLTWATAVALVCYFCAARLGLILRVFGIGGWALVGLIVAGLTTVLLRRRQRRRRNACRPRRSREVTAPAEQEDSATRTNRWSSPFA
jgi:membrane protein DedA with SNARE-associated domain